MNKTKQYNEELQKLEDLEFEYRVALIYLKDEQLAKLAKAKYLRQLKKVDKLKEESE